MRDINATMFFKAKFTIRSISPNTEDLLWKLISDIRYWITTKHNRRGDIVIDPALDKWTAFKFGNRLFDTEGKNRVYAESSYHVSKNNPHHISWACRITEYQRQGEGFAPRDWVTEIGYQSKVPGEADISYVVTFSDLAGFIGFCSAVPPMNVPNVVKGLLQAHDLACYIGDTQITMRPIKLKSGDFPKFKEFLMSPSREVPVLYVAPKRSISDCGVSPSALAESVAGNAFVYYSTDPAFTNEMDSQWDNRYTCANGSVRLYKPHINLSDPKDSYQHRFIPATFIEEHGSDQILNIFRRALAQDIHFYEDLFRLDKCRALIDIDKRDERIAHMLESKDGEVNDAIKYALEELEKREAAERDGLSFCEENIRLKEEIHNLNIQVKAMRTQVEHCSQLDSALNNIRAFSELPNDAASIAQYFAKVFGDRLVFTERAYKSMEDCPTKAELLWEAFYCMATDLYDCLKNDSAHAYKAFSEKTGWECSRGEGKMTRADSGLMRQYEDVYKGHTINIEAHVKNGIKENDPRFVRIYFAYDPSVVDKIIIGHCGKHLDNYSTRKIK